MTRRAALGGLLIQKGQCPALRIDGIRAHAAGFFTVVIADLIHRIQKLFVRMNGEKRRILLAGQFARRRQLTGTQIQLQPMDALPFSTSVGADVHQQSLGSTPQRQDEESSKNQGKNAHSKKMKDSAAFGNFFRQKN